MATTHINYDHNKLDKRMFVINVYDNLIVHPSHKMLFLSNEFVHDEIYEIRKSRNISFNNICRLICDEEHLKTLFEDKNIIIIDTVGMDNKSYNTFLSVAMTNNYYDKYFIFMKQNKNLLV